MLEHIAGWYEHDPNPLSSLHHWKSWHHFAVPMAHRLVDVAGPDAFLQRYKFSDDMLLSNGYSIIRYPDGFLDLNRVDSTMMPFDGSHMPENRYELYDSLDNLRRSLEEGEENYS